MTGATTRRRVLAGVAGGAVATAIGITVSSPANAERPSLSDLWRQWQRLTAEILQSYSQEPDDPGWWGVAGPLLRQCVRKVAMLNPSFSEEDVDEICNRDGERWQGKLYDARSAIEDRITQMPARSIGDVLIKLRVARYWIESDHTVSGVLEAGLLDPHERLALSAYADLERLSDGSAS